MKFDNRSNSIEATDRWLFKETKGRSALDKIILQSVKLIYIGLRIMIRIIIGEAGRDKLWTDKKITFRGFLYKFIEFLRLDNYLLIVFNSPKHNFKFGSRITRKVNNFLIQDVFNGMNFHEEEIIERFTPKEGDIVIDVGPAFGLYTILASRSIGSRGQVFAIEPQPEIFKMLNCNIKLNKLLNVTTLNYAAYSKEIKLKLYNSYSIIQERAGKNNSDFIEVNGNTLDYLMFQNKIKEVNWIKIDVEGAELEVLKGAHNILSKSKDIALLIEIHNLSEGNNLYDDIMNLLKSYNFKQEFEKVYENGERHIIVRKQQL